MTSEPRHEKDPTFPDPSSGPATREQSDCAHRERESDAAEVLASMLHNLANGLAASKTTASAARGLARRDVGTLLTAEWEQLRVYLRVLDHEVQCQVFDALNVLEHLDPGSTTGLLRPVVRRCSPMDLLEEMLPDYRTIAAQRNIAVTVNDSSTGTAPLELEVGAVRRAFHNALSNAVKYSYRGSRSNVRYILIVCKRHLPVSGGYELSFENFGIGIRPNEFKLVWESRYRGEIAREENTLGSGLGLKQIRQCMTRHSGSARIESEPQEGGSYKTKLTLIFLPGKTVAGVGKHG
jgi:signal transduction histidine kinase